MPAPTGMNWLASIYTMKTLILEFCIFAKSQLLWKH